MTSVRSPNANGLAAPHRTIRAADGRERFAIDLLDTLWNRYRGRVSHVRAYERIVSEAGATFVNDHIAFRTFAAQKPCVGIHSIARLFEALGFVAAASYHFPDKSLGSIHYRHPNPRFPKLFISELKTWELSARARGIILKTLATHRPPLNDDFLAALRGVERASAVVRSRLLRAAALFFSERPWTPPRRRDLPALDRESQFAAWTAAHGYDVNHFTASVHSQGVSALSNIEKTAAALRAAGVPMKEAIEGARGSKLRQSATQAAVIDVLVRDGNRTARMPWTYAYFELAERPLLADPRTGKRARFEGFLGGQATQLFGMTQMPRRKS